MVTIQLQVNPAEINLVITDDGLGFDPQHTLSRGGMGLTTMQERAAGLGGVLQIHAAPDQGTAIQLTTQTPTQLKEETV